MCLTALSKAHSAFILSLSMVLIVRSKTMRSFSIIRWDFSTPLCSLSSSGMSSRMALISASAVLTAWINLSCSRSISFAEIRRFTVLALPDSSICAGPMAMPGEAPVPFRLNTISLLLSLYFQSGLPQVLSVPRPPPRHHRRQLSKSGLIPADRQW